MDLINSTKNTCKHVFVVLAIFGFVVGLASTHGSLGLSMIPLLIAVVGLVGVFYGARVGVASVFIFVPIIFFLLVALGHTQKEAFTDMIYARNIFGFVTAVIIGWLAGRMHDVSAEMAKEIEVRKKSEENLRILNERTKKMARELEEAHIKAVEAEKFATLGKMTASLAHEIRNPLGVIRLAAYSLRKKIELNSESERHLLNIDSKITDIDAIIKDLLALSRASELVLVESDINELVKESLKSLGAQIKKAKVTVVQSLDSKKGTVLADQSLLAEVFENIFSNAIEAMGKSKEKILNIKTEDRNGRVIVGIKDTGAGISKENLKKVGTPFFSTNVKGVGLSLYVSREVVKKHNGEISVSSKDGEGTVFTLSFPINLKTK